jgi:uncharacterized protein (UPF0333 family)
MKKNYISRGQSTLEYSMVILCVVTALVAMQYYIKRAVQGRARESADSIGEQYAPKSMSSQITVTQAGSTTIEAEKVVDPKDATKFGLKTTSTTDETTTRTGYENVGKFEDKLFN